MIRVLNLLSLPLLENFKLISSAKGLNNPVSGVGIFEWESPEEIEATFSPGEFIMTTLSISKHNANDAIRGLKALIKKGVAAIAIKTIYFDTCPEEVIALANLHRVPLFIFADTYIDDLIYTIKNTVLSDDANNILQNHLHNIMQSTTKETLHANARNMNPFFHEHLVCFCLIPPHNQPFRGFDEILEYYRESLSDHVSDVPGYSLIQSNNCLIFIYTEKEPITLSRTKLANLPLSLSIPSNEFILGISDLKDNLKDIKAAIEEAVIAAISGVIENESVKHFCETGTDALFLPVLTNEHFCLFYDRMNDTLRSYDETHSSNLFQTLLCYIESEGDISLTAKKLFQHSNTVRYRIDKIKTLLQIESHPDAYIQLYLFAKMHKVRSLFSRDPMNLL